LSSITFLTNTTWHSSHHGLSARHLPVPRVDEPPRARSSCGFPLFVCSRVLSSCPSCDLTADASFSSPGVRSFSGPSSFLWAPSFRRLSRSRADTQSEVMHRVFVSHGPFSPFCGLPDDFGSALSESFSSCEHCLRLMSSSSGTFSFRRVLPSTIHRSFLSCDDPLLPAVILSFFSILATPWPSSSSTRYFSSRPSRPGLFYHFSFRHACIPSAAHPIKQRSAPPWPRLLLLVLFLLRSPIRIRFGFPAASVRPSVHGAFILLECLTRWGHRWREEGE